jgi:putative transposase
VACRVLGVSASGFYEWRNRKPSARLAADEQLTATIAQIHERSRGSYGSPRVHAELRLGQNIRCGRKRVERLMRHAGLQGIYRRRGKGCTVRDPAASPHPDLVNRQFTADRPDRLWVTDITQHRTGQGWLYCAVVLDVYSRRVVGWPIADHLRTELVIDALDMARWRRKPAPGGTVLHADHGCQGGFNRSSQHLDHGGSRWDAGESSCRRRRRVHVGSGQRIGRCVHRCVHLAGLSPHVRCNGSSGG